MILIVRIYCNMYECYVEVSRICGSPRHSLFFFSLDLGDMTYFAIICSTQKIQVNLEVFITYVTNRGKARVMLHIEAGHSNNCQIILKLFRYDIFCIYLWHKGNLKEIWRYQRH